MKTNGGLKVRKASGNADLSYGNHESFPLALNPTKNPCPSKFYLDKNGAIRGCHMTN